MNLNEARDLIASQMREHDLIAQGWTWKWDNAKARMGQCSHGNRRLSFSRDLFTRADEYECLDTILHEIAHALVGPGHGHDATWRMKCRQIGAKPERCHNVKADNHRWTGICSCIGKEFHRHRLSQKIRTHGKCPSCGTLVAWRESA